MYHITFTILNICTYVYFREHATHNTFLYHITHNKLYHNCCKEEKKKNEEKRA